MLDASKIAPERVRPLKRAEYDRLVALGCFENERVELLYGALVAMTPQDPTHSSPVEKLTELLVPALVSRASVRIQLSFAASDDSEPEPDVAVVPRGDYRREHPSSAWLLVEVANTSLSKDRTVKARLYAESTVDEYWIVDVDAHAVEVHRAPREGKYESVTVRRAGETLVVARFEDVTFPVDALF